MVAQKRIRCNGSLITLANPTVQPGDEVMVDGQVVSNKKPITLPTDVKWIQKMNQRHLETGTSFEDYLPSPTAKLWLYYKRRKQVCTEYDPKKRNTVPDYLDQYYPDITSKNRLLMVGRLDYHAEGLMLLTNCGELKRRLEHPVNQQQRIYLMCLDKYPEKGVLEHLSQGLTISKPTKQHIPPIEAEIANDLVQPSLHKMGGTTWVRLVMSGEYPVDSQHVRLAMDHFGLICTRMIRIQFGPYTMLDELKQGVLIPTKLRHLPLPIPAPAPAKGPVEPVVEETKSNRQLRREEKSVQKKERKQRKRQKNALKKQRRFKRSKSGSPNMRSAEWV